MVTATSNSDFAFPMYASLRSRYPSTEQQKAAGAAAARAAAAAAAVDGANAAAGARQIPQRTPATAGAMAGAGMTRNATMMSSSLQSFQLPESDKPMELQLPANAISVTTVAGPPSSTNTSTGGGPAAAPAAHALRMVVGCSDGTVSVYGLPEMALQGRWLLHDMSYGGCTAVCAMGDQLVSVGGEGTVQVSSRVEYVLEATCVVDAARE